MNEEQNRAAKFLRQTGFVVQGPGDRGHEKTILDKRYFRKIIPYAGEEGKWQEYIFSLCVAIGNIPGCGQVSRGRPVNHAEYYGSLDFVFIR